MGYFKSLMGWRNDLTQRRKGAKNSFLCQIPKDVEFMEYNNNIKRSAKRDQINSAPRRADFSFATLRLCASSFFRFIMVDQGWNLSSRQWVGGMTSRKDAKNVFCNHENRD